MTNLTMSEALVLSDALSQYIDNQDADALEFDDAVRTRCVTAERLRDIADQMIADASSVDIMLAQIAAVHGLDDEAEMMAVEMADKAKRRGVA